MSRVCQLTGTKANNGMAVSHSHIRTKKLQQANLQQRRLWWAEGKRWVNLRITTRALRTMQKKGVDENTSFMMKHKTHQKALHFPLYQLTSGYRFPYGA